MTGRNPEATRFILAIIVVMPKARQVGIESDHFQQETGCNGPAGSRATGNSLMSRIRHCLECPGCRTRYLISLSPYTNGSYIVATVNGRCDEYILYCRCRSMASRWRGSDVMTCEVSRGAYERGFGMEDEVVPVHVIPVAGEPEEIWSFDVSNYVNDWKAAEKRKDSV